MITDWAKSTIDDLQQAEANRKRIEEFRRKEGATSRTSHSSHKLVESKVPRLKQPAMRNGRAI